MREYVRTWNTKQLITKLIQLQVREEKLEATGFRGTKTVQQNAFLCTQQAILHLWYRRRTLGVPTKIKTSNTCPQRKTYITLRGKCFINVDRVDKSKIYF